MKLTDKWKEKVSDILQKAYQNGINPDKLNKYLDSIIENSDFDPILKFRNIYEDREFSNKANDILELIENEDLIIGGNGAFTYNQNKGVSIVTDILLNQMAERRKHTDNAIRLQSEGKMNEAYYEDVFQKLLKSRTNSIYGVQTQKGSFLYLPDSAAMITTLAREWTTQCIWFTEAFFSNNLQFETTNEMWCYITNVLNSPRTNDFNSYITYIPTQTDLNKTIKSLINNNSNPENIIKNQAGYLFRILESLDSESKIRLYYKNNLYKLIEKNEKIKMLFMDIFNTDIDLITGDINDPEFPEELGLKLTHFMDILNEYVFLPFSMTGRVNKVENKKRKMVLVSDTDSIFLNLGYVMDSIMKLYDIEISDMDERFQYRLSSIITAIAINIVDKSTNIFAKDIKVLEEYRNKMIFKNEFYFKRMIIFSNIKKAYATYTKIREGEKVDFISYTGQILSLSNMNSYVAKQLKYIFEDILLKSKKPNITELFKILEETYNYIEKELEKGNKTFGQKIRYKGVAVNQNITYIHRSCDIWNRIYVDMPITPGDSAYIIETNLKTLKDCEFLKDIDINIYNNIKNNIFEAPDFKSNGYNSFGLSRIAIPESEDISSIPDWILPHLETFNQITKHLHPMVAVTNSVKLYQNKANTNRNTHTLLLSLN